MTDIWADTGTIDMSSNELAREFLMSLWPEAPWDSEHMMRTPARFAQMLRDLTTSEPFEFTTFESTSDEMVTCTDIPFHSLCAHHVVPYIGVAHVAYIPQGRLVGLSKIPRLVNSLASSLTVQEELTKEIADNLEEELDPLGVAVVMKAEHMCATLRGAKAVGMMTTTSCMRGRFADHERLARSEFLHLIK